MPSRVSVIVPAYNAAPYVLRAVESVLSQTEPNVEVVVVDDGSTDETVAIVREIADPRVRVLENGSNRGPSYSRNRAIEAARGEWIAVLDADDWYAPDRVERLLRVIVEQEADLVIDDQYIVLDGETTPFTSQFRTARTPVSGPLVLDPVSFVRSNRPGFSSLRFGSGKAIMRRAFLAAHGIRYDERVRGVEDSVLYLHCLVRGARFVVVPEAYYYRRKHASSITANLVRMLENDVEVNTDIVREPLIQAHPELAAALQDRLRAAKTHLSFHRFRQALRSRDFQAAGGVVVEHPAVISFVVRKGVDRLYHRIWSGSRRTRVNA